MTNLTVKFPDVPVVRIELVNNKKGANLASVSVVQVVKHVLFDAINQGSSLPFAELFFSLLNSHIASERHLLGGSRDPSTAMQA